MKLLLKVSNGNTRTVCEFCSKLAMKKPELRHWCRSGVFIVNFEQISHIVWIFLLFLLFLERMYYQHKKICLFVVKSQFIKNQKWKSQNLKSIVKKMFYVIKNNTVRFPSCNSFMTEVSIIKKPVHWFADRFPYDRDLRHERLNRISVRNMSKQLVFCVQKAGLCAIERWHSEIQGHS